MAIYNFLSPQYFVFYDIPLFLLFFGLFFLIIRVFLKQTDTPTNTAAAAFSAALAFILVRSQSAVYHWFLWNWQSVFGILVVLIIFILAFFMLKLGL